MFCTHSEAFQDAQKRPIHELYSFSSRTTENPLLAAEPRLAPPVRDPIEPLKELTWLLREQHDAQYGITSSRQAVGDGETLYTRHHSPRHRRQYA